MLLKITPYRAFRAFLHWYRFYLHILFTGLCFFCFFSCLCSIAFAAQKQWRSIFFLVTTNRQFIWAVFFAFSLAALSVPPPCTPSGWWMSGVRGRRGGSGSTVLRTWPPSCSWLLSASTTRSWSNQTMRWDHFYLFVFEIRRYSEFISSVSKRWFKETTSFGTNRFGELLLKKKYIYIFGMKCYNSK